MHTLWFLVAWVAAHTRMAQLARRGADWKHLDVEAEWWAQTLSRLDPPQKREYVRQGTRVAFWKV
jgi:hypothetical protein